MTYNTEGNYDALSITQHARVFVYFRWKGVDSYVNG